MKVGIWASLAALAALSSPISESLGRQGSVAGVYTLLICRGGCRDWDTTRAYLTATVVLLDSTMKAADGSPIRARYQLAANGCYRKRELKRVRNSYAPFRETGYLLWERDSTAGIVFPLYRSPDAGYEVAVTFTADGARGTGESWGAGAAEIHAPRDSVVLHRQGAPDAGFCDAIAR